MNNGSGSIVQAIAATPSPKPGASRTRLLIEGPIVRTLLQLAAPNVVVNVVLIAVTATVDAHFIGKIGSSSLAGISLVFPLIMLMQQMANSSMGGAIASAIARAIGAGRHADASALVIHGMVIAVAMAALFTSVLLIGGPANYTLMGGTDDTLASALEYSNAIFAGALAYWVLSTLTSVVRGAGRQPCWQSSTLRPRSCTSHSCRHSCSALGHCRRWASPVLVSPRLHRLLRRAPSLPGTSLRDGPPSDYHSAASGLTGGYLSRSCASALPCRCNLSLTI